MTVTNDTAKRRSHRSVEVSYQNCPLDCKHAYRSCVAVVTRHINLRIHAHIHTRAQLVNSTQVRFRHLSTVYRPNCSGHQFFSVYIVILNGWLFQLWIWLFTEELTDFVFINPDRESPRIRVDTLGHTNNWTVCYLLSETHFLQVFVDCVPPVCSRSILSFLVGRPWNLSVQRLLW